MDGSSTDICQSHFRELVSWGERFIELAWWAALIIVVASGLIAALKLFEGLKDPAKNLTDSPYSSVVDSLKGLIDSLKTAPVWFSVFLAGMALLWVAGKSADNCMALVAKGADNHPQIAKELQTPGTSGHGMVMKVSPKSSHH